MNIERKKFQRIIREKELMDQEHASDELIRAQVQQEFPPLAIVPLESGGISDALRRAIQSSPKSVYQICKEAGISQIVISRFLSGERDIRLATADRLARTLGLEIVNH